jgi:hypothetical protein
MTDSFRWLAANAELDRVLELTTSEPVERLMLLREPYACRPATRERHNVGMPELSRLNPT